MISTRALLADYFSSFLFEAVFCFLCLFLTVFSSVWALAQVDDACPLAALAALSFDANQLKKAEWYTAYPQVPLAFSDHALRRANALSPPPPSPDSTDYAGPVKAMLKLMNAQRLSALAAITHGGVGSITGAMSMIADIVRVEIDWQLFVMRPSSSLNLNPVTTSTRAAASEPRSRQTDSRPGIPVPASAPVDADAVPKVVV